MIRAMIHSIGVFPLEWVISRRGTGNNVWAVVPAVLLAVILLCISVVFRSASARIALAAQYVQSAAEAAADGRQEEREMYLRRAIELSNGDRAIRYEHARTLLTLNQTDRAFGILRSLAPADEPGYRPAHRMLAEHLLKNDLESPQLLHHLQHGVDPTQGDVQMRLKLAQRLTDAGNFAAAADQLALVAESRPSEQLMLGQLLMRAGRNSDASTAFKKAETYYTEKLNQSAKDVDARILLAQTHIFQRRIQSAIDVLNSGLQYDDDEFRIRDALAKSWLAWFDMTPVNNTDKRLFCLDNAIQLNPDNPETMKRYAILAFQLGLSDKTRNIEQRLEKTLTRGSAPMLAHVLLGSAAARDGDFRRALVHLELANRQSPDHPIVANNLAWVLRTYADEIGKAEPSHELTNVFQRLFNGPMTPDTSTVLERALDLSTRATIVAPSVANFHETRGQILAKMSRWSDCVSELESALRLGRDTSLVHSTLADAYQQLNLPKMEAMHRAVLDKNKSTMSVPDESNSSSTLDTPENFESNPATSRLSPDSSKR